MSLANLLPVNFQFEQATVNYKNEFSEATGRKMPKLDCMLLDQYGYQRELSVSFRWRPGDSRDLFWEISVYQHPNRRWSSEVSASYAEAFILRFAHLCIHYPSLLFNNTGEHLTDKQRPRGEGFVRLCERLHRGEKVKPSDI